MARTTANHKPGIEQSITQRFPQKVWQPALCTNDDTIHPGQQPEGFQELLRARTNKKDIKSLYFLL
jgi:hypothetical protein